MFKKAQISTIFDIKAYEWRLRLVRDPQGFVSPLHGIISVELVDQFGRPVEIMDDDVIDNLTNAQKIAIRNVMIDVLIKNKAEILNGS